MNGKSAREQRLATAKELGYLVLETTRPVPWWGYGKPPLRDVELDNDFWRWCREQDMPRGRIFRCSVQGVASLEVDFNAVRVARELDTIAALEAGAAVSAECVIRAALPWLRTTEEMNETLPGRRVCYTREEQAATDWSCGRGTWRVGRCPMDEAPQLMAQLLVTANEYPRARVVVA